MKINVLSLFDGISCLQIILTKLGIKYDNYFSSEIDIANIIATKWTFPNTHILGNVKDINTISLPKIWLLSAGSPCQDFSGAGKRRGMTTEQGIIIKSLKQYLSLKKKNHKFIGQSYLFWEFIRILRETKPKYFFLENVEMNQDWENIITKELGVLPHHINSSLLSAQNRSRVYWTNIPDVFIPKDKNIKLSDVIPGSVAGHGIRGIKCNTTNGYKQNATTRKDNKANCVVTKIGNTSKIKMKDGSVRSITIEEAELLQGLKKGYTNIPGLSKSDRIRAVGNGWQIDTVEHIFRNLKK